MAGLLTLKQLSSVFQFKFVVGYLCVLLLLSFDIEINACVATSTASLSSLSLFNPEKTSRLSKAIKIVKDIKSERTATIGTVGSLLSSSGITSNRIPVNSTKLGNAVGYLLAGTFFTATIAQTLYNWDSKPANAFLSGLANRIVPNIFETAEVDTDTRRSDDYTGNVFSSRKEKYCFKCSRKCSEFLGHKAQTKKR